MQVASLIEVTRSCTIQLLNWRHTAFRCNIARATRNTLPQVCLNIQREKDVNEKPQNPTPAEAWHTLAVESFPGAAAARWTVHQPKCYGTSKYAYLLGLVQLGGLASAVRALLAGDGRQLQGPGRLRARLPTKEKAFPKPQQARDPVARV